MPILKITRMCYCTIGETMSPVVLKHVFKLKLVSRLSHANFNSNEG